MSCNVTCQDNIAARCQNQTNPVFVAVYSVVCTTGIILNFMALVVFFCCTKSRSYTMVYMTNLAIADLLLVCTLPLRIYFHLGFQGLSQKTCEVAGLILLANMYGSILLLTCVSLDRCLAVCFPVSSRVREGRKKAPLVCLGIWMLTIGASLPLYINSQGDNLGNQSNCFRSFPKYALKPAPLASSLTVGFVIPLIIMVLCSWGLVRAVSQSTAAQMSGLLDSWKIQRMVSINLAIFLCCFLPYHVMLVVIYSYSYDIPSIPCSVISAYYYSLMVTCLNAILDPLAYYFTTETFRKNIEIDGVRRMLPMNNLSSDGIFRSRPLASASRINIPFGWK
ncbi:lysophosphatidic acid receptor 6 [Neoarius graeffei]|uniref:lysophosphatidic acid receptor 6 n=1 Tax=Neoarius graeffei TaxID=443677 RepID=UPI00298D4868|nr:lysophosphatidic acid receptor 6 [Neoarius graeffei]XP_060779983.1 lysophosphatidic acid receptor 6 [Neoarius graeffei]